MDHSIKASSIVRQSDHARDINQHQEPIKFEFINSENIKKSYTVCIISNEVTKTYSYTAFK